MGLLRNIADWRREEAEADGKMHQISVLDSSASLRTTQHEKGGPSLR